MPIPPFAPSRQRRPMLTTSLPPPDSVPMIDAPAPMSLPSPTTTPATIRPSTIEVPSVPALKFTKPSCITVVPSARCAPSRTRSASPIRTPDGTTHQPQLVLSLGSIQFRGRLRAHRRRTQPGRRVPGVERAAGLGHSGEPETPGVGRVSHAASLPDLHPTRPGYPQGPAESWISAWGKRFPNAEIHDSAGCLEVCAAGGRSSPKLRLLWHGKPPVDQGVCCFRGGWVL